jgi:UDP-N-acetylglucosamine transferase subunit ALG13
VILLVLGTHPQPFPRAARLAAQLARIRGEELEVQHGWTAPVPDLAARWRPWYTRLALEDAMRAASAVIVHGGSGCIYRALSLGVRPVVIPRLAGYGEHVDDHQLQLCRRLAADGAIVAWLDRTTAEEVARRLGEALAFTLPTHPDLRPSVWAAAHTLARGQGRARRRRTASRSCR